MNCKIIKRNLIFAVFCFCKTIICVKFGVILAGFTMIEYLLERIKCLYDRRKIFIYLLVNLIKKLEK